MRSAQILPGLLMLMLALTACPGDGNGDGNGADGGGVSSLGPFERGTQNPGDPCNGTIDCTPGSICYSNICVQEGVLRFSLSWDADVDFDLHVLTPDGQEIYWENDSASGGLLDVDDCVGGLCELMDNKHVENVFFDETAMSGQYTYFVQNFSGVLPGTFTLVVAKDGDVVATQTGSLVAEKDIRSMMYTYSF